MSIKLQDIESIRVVDLMEIELKSTLEDELNCVVFGSPNIFNYEFQSNHEFRSKINNIRCSICLCVGLWYGRISYFTNISFGSVQEFLRHNVDILDKMDMEHGSREEFADVWNVLTDSYIPEMLDVALSFDRIVRVERMHMKRLKDE